MLRPEDLLLVTSTRHGDAVVLESTGEIDIHSAPVLVEHARLALVDGVRRLCIDLSEVLHLDSSGIAALVNIRRYVLRNSGALVLVSVRPQTMHLLEFAGLDRYFTVVATREDALDELAASSA